MSTILRRRFVYSIFSLPSLIIKTTKLKVFEIFYSRPFAYRTRVRGAIELRKISLGRYNSSSFEIVEGENKSILWIILKIFNKSSSTTPPQCSFTLCYSSFSLLSVTQALEMRSNKMIFFFFKCHKLWEKLLFSNIFIAETTITSQNDEPIRFFFLLLLFCFVFFYLVL